jgi:hypothetical protein
MPGFVRADISEAAGTRINVFSYFDCPKPRLLAVGLWEHGVGVLARWNRPDWIPIDLPPFQKALEMPNS